MLNEWQYWGTPTDEDLATTPDDIKREWGLRFGKLSPGMERTLKLFGPIQVFEGICRLVRDGKIVVRCMLMPFGNQYRWRVEYRLTLKGSEFIKVNTN